MKKILVVLNLIVLLVIFKFGVFLWLREIPSSFSLVAFDVGQGDALMLTIPETTIQILIDGGPDGEVVSGIKKYLPKSTPLKSSQINKALTEALPIELPHWQPPLSLLLPN